MSNSKKTNLNTYETPDIFTATNYVQSLVSLYGSARVNLPRRKKHKALVIGSQAKKLSKALSQKYSDSISFIELQNIASGGIKQKTANYSALNKIQTSPDIIFMYHALECIDDDIGYISEIHSKLNTGGVLIIISPAHQALYSSIDKLSNRHRRYGLMEMKKIVTSMGLRAVKSYYCDPLGALSYVAYKLMDNGKGQLSVNLIAYYDKHIFRISQRLQIFTKKLFGKDIVIVSVKK